MPDVPYGSLSAPRWQPLRVEPLIEYLDKTNADEATRLDVLRQYKNEWKQRRLAVEKFRQDKGWDEEPEPALKEIEQQAGPLSHPDFPPEVLLINQLAPRFGVKSLEGPTLAPSAGLKIKPSFRPLTGEAETAVPPESIGGPALGAPAGQGLRYDLEPGKAASAGFSRSTLGYLWGVPEKPLPEERGPYMGPSPMTPAGRAAPGVGPFSSTEAGRAVERLAAIPGHMAGSPELGLAALPGVGMPLAFGAMGLTGEAIRQRRAQLAARTEGKPEPGLNIPRLIGKTSLGALSGLAASGAGQLAPYGAKTAAEALGLMAPSVYGHLIETNELPSQRQIAEETLESYATIAGMKGIGALGRKAIGTAVKQEAPEEAKPFDQARQATKEAEKPPGEPSWKEVVEGEYEHALAVPQERPQLPPPPAALLEKPLPREPGGEPSPQAEAMARLLREKPSQQTALVPSRQPLSPADATLLGDIGPIEPGQYSISPRPREIPYFPSSMPGLPEPPGPTPPGARWRTRGPIVETGMGPRGGPVPGLERPVGLEAPTLTRPEVGTGIGQPVPEPPKPPVAAALERLGVRQPGDLISSKQPGPAHEIDVAPGEPVKAEGLISSKQPRPVREDLFELPPPAPGEPGIAPIESPVERALRRLRAGEFNVPPAIKKPRGRPKKPRP